MKLYRFMSDEEFAEFMTGKKLHNHTKHEGRTDSVGFCFMPLEQDTPEDAYRYLNGVVSHDICAIFETGEKMKKGYGIYSDYSKGWGHTQKLTEYSTTEYDNTKFKILKVCINFHFAHWHGLQWKWHDGGIL